MSGNSEQMARDLERLTRDLEAQKLRLNEMAEQIARFTRDREESLRGHAPFRRSIAGPAPAAPPTRPPDAPVA